MEHNMPEYKEIFRVFGVRSQAFSSLILAAGRNKRKLAGEVVVSLLGGDAHIKAGFVNTSNVHN